MAGITQAQAETKLAEVLTAYEKALNALEYGTGDLKVKRNTIEALQQQITFWETKVNTLSGGGISVRGGIPLDG